MTELTRVVQARLNPGNVDEAQALDILSRWMAEGLSTRQVMTRALLSLDGQDIPETDAVRTIRRMMGEMQTEMVNAVASLLETRLDELAAMAPKERRAQVQQAARSTFASSILNAIDVADYEGSGE